MTRDETIKNRVEAINKLHLYMNMIVPEVQKLDLKFKKGGTLYESSKKALELLKPNGDKSIRMYITNTYRSPFLKADITYKTGEYSCAYYDTYACLNKEYKPFELIDLKTLMEEVNTLPALTEQYIEIKSRVDSINYKAFGR